MDSDYAQKVYVLDSQFIALMTKPSEELRKELAAQKGVFNAFYKDLESYIDAHLAALQALPGVERETPLIARQTAISMLAFIEEILSMDSDFAHSTVTRDQAMAKNLEWLADTLYSGKKIVVWAHNYHAGYTSPSVPNMGSFSCRGSKRRSLHDRALYVPRSNGAQQSPDRGCEVPT